MTIIISNSEKLVYLRHSLKDGRAMKAIEGLSRSGEHYLEAIELLQARFNRPRLIHQTHVDRILNAPSLKEGNGRELRYLHDTVQQHLRALKAMGYEPSGPFITSVIELKLDVTTMFEWQKHSQSCREVPHYQDLLDFIDLRAQASETTINDQTKGQSRIGSNIKRNTGSSRPSQTSLIDVLLKFRFHRYALTTDVSKMYRAIKLTQSDRDYHRFVWRRNPTDPLREYRMTRLTFGVSASSFAANMAVKQNAMDFSLQYPMAVQRVYEAFYVDDGLTGADSIPETIHLQRQLQELFERGGFTLRKWNSNNSEILDHLPTDLKEKQPIQTIAEEDQYTKTLGIKWNSVSDTFRITVAEINHNDIITKRTLISDVSKTFDILGWFSPTIIKVKILFQRLWELKIDWDDPVPEEVRLTWSQWRSELSILSTKYIPRCYFPLEFDIKKTHLHGFSDASEDAYSAAVYFRFEDTSGKTHITLITSKTKVAPMKRLTIPRLELCGAHLLSDVLSHVKNIFQIPMCDTYAWTDSTIAIDWLNGNPRRLKTFVGNRVSHIINLIPPDRWNHVSGGDNPADCASRGLFPLALINHDMWWDGPPWLSKDPSEWPKSHVTTPINTEELRGVSLATNVRSPEPIIPLNRYSDFNHLKKTTSWVLRFVNNCRKFMSNTQQVDKSCILSVEEMEIAERYWIKLVQKTCFADEINVIKKNKLLQRESCLVSLHPFIDDKDILRLSGRISNSNLHYEQIHPIILHGKHQITKMIIRAEHLRLLHAGP